MRTDRAFLSSHEVSLHTESQYLWIHFWAALQHIRISLSIVLYEIYESLQLEIIFFLKGGIRNRKRSKKRQQNKSESFCNVFLPLSQDVERSKNWPQNCTPVPLKAGSRDMSMGPGQREAPSIYALGRGKQKYLLRESKQIK